MWGSYRIAQLMNEEIVANYVSRQSTSPVADNRQHNVGSSDIGSCPLKVVKQKRIPREFTTATYWHFLRGHTREEVLAPLHARVVDRFGTPFVDQLRARHVNQDRFRAHLDRTYMNAPTIEEATHLRIVEEKCPKLIPDSPHDSWVYQVQFQMGLLLSKYPDKKVDAQILATDLAGGVTDFNLTFKPNERVIERLWEKGELIIRHIDAGTDPDPEPDFLCGFCSFRTECPAFGDKIPESDEILDAVAAFVEARDMEKEGKTQRDDLKERFKALLITDGVERFRGVIGDYVVTCSQRRGRKGIDAVRLEAEYPDAYEACKTEGDPFYVLEVK